MGMTVILELILSSVLFMNKHMQGVLSLKGMHQDCCAILGCTIVSFPDPQCGTKGLGMRLGVHKQQSLI